MITSAAGTTLLNYAISTNPDPLQVSPQNADPSYGALTIVVSNGGDLVVFCQSIRFTIPVGDLAQDLTATTTTTGIHLAATDGWNFSQISPGVFVAIAATLDDAKVAEDGLVFQIYNVIVNEQVGTVTMQIDEMASLLPVSESTEVALPTERDDTLDIPKFPFAFSFSNLAPSAPLVPHGSPVTLTWVGSDGPAYWMTAGGNPPVNVTNTRRWLTPFPLTSDTTFLLEASVIEQGATVKTYQSTTVIVSNPDFQASSLTVHGPSRLVGATTVEPSLAVTGPISGFGTVPIGTVLAYAGDAAATEATLNAKGWLFCDGTAISRTKFQELFDAIGVLHGNGDGSTTFNLPDYRGYFLRGADHGSGHDPDIARRVAPQQNGGSTGANVGSYQPFATARPAYNALTSSEDGAHSHTISHVPESNCSYRIAGSTLAKWTDDASTTSVAPPHTHVIAGGGDLETRPTNLSVDYIIRST